MTRMAVGSKIGNHFRANLRAAIESKGLTQTDVAAVCGVGRPYLNRVLQGLQDPTLGAVEKIARGLGIDATDLLVGRTKKN